MLWIMSGTFKGDILCFKSCYTKEKTAENMVCCNATDMHTTEEGRRKGTISWMSDQAKKLRYNVA